MKKFFFSVVLCILVFSGRIQAQSSLIEDSLFRNLVKEFLMINPPYKILKCSLDTCIAGDKREVLLIKKTIFISNNKKILLISYPFQDSTKISCYIAEIYLRKPGAMWNCPPEYAFEDKPQKQFFLKEGERYAILDSQLANN